MVNSLSSDPLLIEVSLFINWNEIPVNEVAPGVRIKAPYGENLMISLLDMDEGAVVPLHHHPHEQGGIMISGKMELTIGDETRTVTKDEAYLIGPNVCLLYTSDAADE